MNISRIMHAYMAEHASTHIQRMAWQTSQYHHTNTTTLPILYIGIDFTPTTNRHIMKNEADTLLEYLLHALPPNATPYIMIYDRTNNQGGEIPAQHEHQHPFGTNARYLTPPYGAQSIFYTHHRAQQRSHIHLVAYPETTSMQRTFEAFLAQQQSHAYYPNNRIDIDISTATNSNTETKQ